MREAMGAINSLGEDNHQPPILGNRVKGLRNHGHINPDWLGEYADGKITGRWWRSLSMPEPITQFLWGRIPTNSAPLVVDFPDGS